MRKLENFSHAMFGELSVFGTPEKPIFNAGEVALKLWTQRDEGVNGDLRPDMNKIRKALSTSNRALSREFTKDSFITEKQLYKAIFKSNSPHAEEFQIWVIEDILPTIRRTGAFIAKYSAELVI